MFEQNTESSQFKALDLLGLEPDATVQDAASAYRRLASKYHPDRVSHLSVELQEVARQQMIRINRAYDCLRNTLPDVMDILDDVVERSSENNSADLRDEGNVDEGDATDNHNQFVTFGCPYCSARIKVPSELRGKIGHCTRCQQKITVPTHVELRCENCGQRNRLPSILQRKRAICRKCYGSLARAAPTS